MNDRFKFRVWDKGNEHYVDCADMLYIEPSGEITYACYDGDREDMYYYEQNDVVIEQCTGLRDKNGKLIYEGDIVTKKFTDRPFSNKTKSKMKNCSVYWHKKGEFLFKYKDDKYKYYSVPYDSFIGDCEIIGNIHENPELLE